MVVEKSCSRCKVTKNVVFFSRDRSSNDGHQYKCKNCQSFIKTSKTANCIGCGCPKANTGSILCRKCSNELNPYYSGRRRSYDGYIRILDPECPISPKTGNKRYIVEHRHLYEKYLGRKLLDYENIHHKNGNKSDNRLENLELWSCQQPNGQRVEDKLKWAKEILELYDKK